MPDFSNFKIDLRNSEDLNNSDKDQIKNSFKEILELLSQEWEFSPEEIGKEAKISLSNHGARLVADEQDQENDYIAFISHPKTHENTKLFLTEEVKQLSEELHPFPLDGISEAGHLVSRRVNNLGISDSFDKAVFNELHDARAQIVYDPKIVESELKFLHNNLEILQDMYSEEHSEYIWRIRDEIREELESFEDNLKNTESEKELRRIVHESNTVLEEYLEELPSHNLDHKSYSRHPSVRPPTLSQRFVERFIEAESAIGAPLIKYAAESSEDFYSDFSWSDVPTHLWGSDTPETTEELFEETRNNVEQNLQFLDSIDSYEDIGQYREDAWLNESVNDRVLVISKELGQLSEKRGIDGLLYEDLDGLRSRFGEYLVDRDEELVDRYMV